MFTAHYIATRERTLGNAGARSSNGNTNSRAATLDLSLDPETAASTAAAAGSDTQLPEDGESPAEGRHNCTCDASLDATMVNGFWLSFDATTVCDVLSGTHLPV